MQSNYLNTFRFDFLDAPRWKLWVLLGVSGTALALCTASALSAPIKGKTTTHAISSVFGIALGGIFLLTSRQLEETEYPQQLQKVVKTKQIEWDILQHLPIEYDEVVSMQQNQTVGSTAPIESKSLELFDWNRFNTERDDFPHIIIAGKTGGGKSYLAEYLASLFEGFTIAVSPHWKKGDFTSADLVIGWGRNTGDAAQFEHSFADILTGNFNVSVGGFMYALLQEMDRRYQLDPITQEYVGANDPEIVVILDEFNLYANMDGLPIITKQLLREARKVRIRLIPLVQGTEVKALGVEGEGQLREQLTFIRVRNKAVELVNQEISKHRNDEFLGYWQGVKNFVSSSRYACFVDDIPAQIPDLTEWKQLQPPLANLAGVNVQSVDGVGDIDLLKRCYSLNPTQFQHTTRMDDNCPGCESTHISPHGKTRAGTPRQRCNDCGKTWTIK